MRIVFTLLIIAISCVLSQAQKVKDIKEEVLQKDLELHVRFLASDALMGREAGTEYINIAASYIASYFESRGIKRLPGMNSYFQKIPFYKITPSSSGELVIGQYSFLEGKEFVSVHNNSVNLIADPIYLGYGDEEEIANYTIKDKVALVKAGTEGGTGRQALSPNLINEVRSRLAAKGARAVIFLYDYKQPGWEAIAHYYGGEQLVKEKPVNDNGIPYFLINATNETLLKDLKKVKSGISINYSGRQVEKVYSYNVLGMIEGADDKGKKDYLLLGGHYDHVGGEKSDSVDLIYNGARDNAIGTAAVMMAGDYFTTYKPKRSIIFALWTAEEKGLLGSKYFIENSPVPIENIFYHLNIDNGGGYNDTTKVTVIGLERTQAKEAIIEAAAAFDLDAIPSPEPAMNIFNRSDNVNFARAGIPAPIYGLGFTAYNDELKKFYHQPIDEASTLNFRYIIKYVRSYVLTAQKIVNGETETFWQPGDPYEEAGKKLYGLE